MKVNNQLESYLPIIKFSISPCLQLFHLTKLVELILSIGDYIADQHAVSSIQ